MTPINEVPVGKFCRFDGKVVYVCSNDFKNTYMLYPIVGFVPQDKEFNAKVYIYKRPQKEWIERAKEGIKNTYTEFKRLDNLTYIENLDILKSYDV